jgi:hypothetical protein
MKKNPGVESGVESNMLVQTMTLLQVAPRKTFEIVMIGGEKARLINALKSS